MKKAKQMIFLNRMDDALLPIGFTRKKNSQEWKSKESGPDLLWIHMNFGLKVFNPSFGITFTDLERSLPKESGAVFSVQRMLSSITGEIYYQESDPGSLANDILEEGIPNLNKLTSRSKLIELLESEDTNSWPVLSASHRARLLPLLYMSSGRTDLALERAKVFESNASNFDQIIPRYSVFVEYLEESIKPNK